MTESLIAFAALLALVALRVPIAFAMGLVGFAGFGIAVGWSPSMAMAVNVTYETGLAYSLSVVPLFILMGNFVRQAGLSDELYAASYAFLGHRRGGLAMATIVACGGFSAVCGSSLATAATMSKVAMPPMRRFGYADSLAAGSIAAGGTLGILIPPSVILVIYGIMTESNIDPRDSRHRPLSGRGDGDRAHQPGLWPARRAHGVDRALACPARRLGCAGVVHAGHRRHLRRRLYADRGGLVSVPSAVSCSPCYVAGLAGAT